MTGGSPDAKGSRPPGWHDRQFVRNLPLQKAVVTRPGSVKLYGTR